MTREPPLVVPHFPHVKKFGFVLELAVELKILSDTKLAKLKQTGKGGREKLEEKGDGASARNFEFKRF